MEKFSLRVASKRQVTLPARLLELLRIDEGDVLELVVEKGQVSLGRGLKLVPASWFTEEMLEDLKKREKSLDSGGGVEVNNREQLAEKIFNA